MSGEEVRVEELPQNVRTALEAQYILVKQTHKRTLLAVVAFLAAATGFGVWQVARSAAARVVEGTAAKEAMERITNFEQAAGRAAAGARAHEAKAQALLGGISSAHLRVLDCGRTPELLPGAGGQDKIRFGANHALHRVDSSKVADVSKCAIVLTCEQPGHNAAPNSREWPIVFDQETAPTASIWKDNDSEFNIIVHWPGDAGRLKKNLSLKYNEGPSDLNTPPRGVVVHWALVALPQ